MSKNSEEPSLLLLLWLPPETADVCRVREAEVYDEDWRLCHQTSRKLYNWNAGLLDAGFYSKTRMKDGSDVTFILAEFTEAEV